MGGNSRIEITKILGKNIITSAVEIDLEWQTRKISNINTSSSANWWADVMIGLIVRFTVKILMSNVGQVIFVKFRMFELVDT